MTELSLETREAAELARQRIAQHLRDAPRVDEETLEEARAFVVAVRRRAIERVARQSSAERAQDRDAALKFAKTFGEALIRRHARESLTSAEEVA